MLTFKQYLMEYTVRSKVLYHITPSSYLNRILTSGKLLPKRYSKVGPNFGRTGYKFKSRGREIDSQTITNNRIHFTNNLQLWADNFGMVLAYDKKAAVFRILKQNISKYKWKVQDIDNPDYDESDLYTTKPVSLKHLEIFNFNQEEWVSVPNPNHVKDYLATYEEIIWYDETSRKFYNA